MSVNRFDEFSRPAQAVWHALIAFAVAILCFATAQAQAQATAGTASAQPAGDLTQLVGRIALYPDDLIAIILPAATSPLQIVQADRYLDKRKSDPKLPLDDKWDDPVKSLLNYPDIVKMMSTDLDWTSELGEEVVTDQAAVLEAVQVFRRQAQAAGNLKSDTKQVVKAEKEIIIIEPADPQVVYVPQYNPSTVVVYSSAPVWGYYPTPYPSYYYPYAPGAAMAAGVIWGAAIGAAWSGNRYGWGGGNDININRNTNISTGGNTINRGQGGSGQGAQWKSNKQPGQVSSSVGKTPSSGRVGDARGGASGARASAQPAGGFDRAGAGAGGDRGSAAAGGGNRASSQPAGGYDRGGGDRAGAGAGAGAARPSTQPAGGGGRSGGGDSAFGGYSSGRQTQMDSSRGASSRSASSGGGARPTPSGGGSRGGGGGRGGGRR